MNKKRGSQLDENSDELPSLQYEKQKNQLQRHSYKKNTAGLNLFESLISTGQNQEPFLQLIPSFQNDYELQIEKLSIKDFQNDRKAIVEGRQIRNIQKKSQNRLQLDSDEEYVVKQEEQRIRFRNERKNRSSRRFQNAKNILICYRRIVKEYLLKFLPKKVLPPILLSNEYLNFNDFRNLFDDQKIQPLLLKMFEERYIQRQIQLGKSKNLKTICMLLEYTQIFKEQILKDIQKQEKQ